MTPGPKFGRFPILRNYFFRKDSDEQAAPVLAGPGKLAVHGFVFTHIYNLIGLQGIFGERYG
jgi:hypothetical protein